MSWVARLRIQQGVPSLVAFCVAALMLLMDSSLCPGEFGYLPQPWLRGVGWPTLCDNHENEPLGMLIRDEHGVRVVDATAPDGEPMWIKVREGKCEKLADLMMYTTRECFGPCSGCVLVSNLSVRVWPAPFVDKSQIPDDATIREGFGPVVERWRGGGSYWRSMGRALRGDCQVWHWNIIACVHDFVLLSSAIIAMLGLSTLVGREVGRMVAASVRSGRGAA